MWRTVDCKSHCFYCCLPVLATNNVTYRTVLFVCVAMYGRQSIVYVCVCVCGMCGCCGLYH